MPKTYLTKQEKLNNDLSAWLIGTMKVKHIRQSEAAEALGIKQQALSYKIKNGSYKFEDLVGLFQILEPDADTVMRLLGVDQ